MLSGLSIRDFVLIDRLDIAFRPGLTVLTGETGAGKSILLDALGLALGARAESGTIRPGAEQLAVAAEFSAVPELDGLLADQGIATEDSLRLRRVAGTDGRSRAFVNEQPVGVALLRRCGDALVEVHGQFESRALLDAAAHRVALDAHAGIDAAAVRAAWDGWRAAIAAHAAARDRLAATRADADQLAFAAEELATLDPQPGEEEALAKRRALLMAGARLIEALTTAQAALSARGGDVETGLRAAVRALERVAGQAQGRLDPAILALDRAATEAAEARAALERVAADLDPDPRAIEAVEERLFALRAASRKHRVPVTGLPDLRRRLSAELAALAAGEDEMAGLAKAEAGARAAYVDAAAALTRERVMAAKALDLAIAAELAPLKLERARFVTAVERRDEGEWGPQGCDRVAFLVATSPDAAPGPLARIASGGELARLMLALRVVLARAGAVGTLIFDEVDSGVGGAVAAAVGEQLARLARDLQVLVVTHSPQVAARGDHHLLVSRVETGGRARVVVTELDAAGRREEVARMLAGARVTDQARAAAASLLEKAG